MLQRTLTAPRRLLMTVDSVGGVWRWSLDVATALAARGCETVLVGSGPEPGPAQRADAEAVRGLRLVWIDAPLDWLAAGEADLAAVPRELSALAAGHAVDLVHLNVPSQAVGIEVACPVVVMSHSCVRTWWQAVRGGRLPEAWEWQGLLHRRGFERADLILAPSRAHAADLTRAYGPIGPLQVVANGTGFEPGPPHPAKEEFVLAAGRWWDAGKNGAALDEAARLSPWPIVLAGALVGPNGERFDPTRVQALGELPSADLRDLMRRAAVFAAPAHYEPFGLAVLEAARAGCALVLSDIPTFLDLWGGAALFVQPREPVGIAGAVARLKTDPGLRAEYGERAAERARRFTLDRQADALVAAYARALAGVASPIEAG